MAQIVINEISQNYTYNIGSSSYATVALPITAAWGPGYFRADAVGVSEDEALENATWIRYPATQQGLEQFVAAYRGPATNYRLSKDYSYQVAMTLLTAGYDVLVCRLCPGSKAAGEFSKNESSTQYVVLSAQPDDWATNYTNYFTKSGDDYIPVVAADDYVDIHTENKPDDWDENWASYYTKNASDEYVPNEEQTWSTAKAQEGGIYRKDEVAPEFAENTYYKEEAVIVGTPLVNLTAKYPGSFGNNLSATITKKHYAWEGAQKPYWNLILYVTDSTGVKTAIENLSFVFDVENSNDTILHWSEVESKFIDISAPDMTDNTQLDTTVATLSGGSDRQAEVDTDTVSSVLTEAEALAAARFKYVGGSATPNYVSAIDAIIQAGTADLVSAYSTRYMEWLYTSAVGFNDGSNVKDGVFTLLYDKLAYNPNRVVSPGWDDQNLKALGSDLAINELSPMHIALMNVGYYSRCATAYIDIPQSVARSEVYGEEGYAQLLSRYAPMNTVMFSTHSALFAPWGQYTYVGTAKQTPASPSFLALMIQRAQILNQSLQYEWALPTNRKHNLRIGKLDYNVPKKLLDIWQTLEGVGVNVIANIPDLGMNVWGNSTLYEVPPATYQALANLSTRWLVNAIEDVAYKVGISITFQYNNQEAYSSFYAGVSPTLDTMRNVGAIDDYYITMSADIDGLSSVNANSVIGKIYITVAGVINDITIDLIALPTSVDLDQFRA
jgi:hypothetical protein